ncbi:serpin family protein [Virgibacillus sp. FSP13]
MKRITISLVLVSLLTLTIGCGGDSTSQEPGFLSNADFAEEDYKKIVASNNELGFKLLAEVEADENNNIFISPTSLLLALSMVYNGADSMTKEEIAKTLQAEGIEVNELNKANASLITMLHNNSDHTKLNIANSIWLNENFHFQDDFTKSNTDYFNAEIQEIDVSDSESSGMINEWVKKSTNNKIKKIVASRLDPDLVAILINAIYFKGEWTYEFNKDQTEDRSFHLKDGTTKDIPLMTLTEELLYLENENFQAVTLPYGDDEMSMNIFLPKKDSSLEEFKKTLTNETWEQLGSEFRPKEGTIMLPKFQLEYETSLNETLKDLGMTTAFNKDADFSKMIKEDNPLWISKVKQKTFINVNEEGTEAAATTSVDVVTESITIDGPFRMEVNRPFFIAITDNETDTIVFMGGISNPQKED